MLDVATGTHNGDGYRLTAARRLGLLIVSLASILGCFAIGLQAPPPTLAASTVFSNPMSSSGDCASWSPMTFDSTVRGDGGGWCVNMSGSSPVSGSWPAVPGHVYRVQAVAVKDDSAGIANRDFEIRWRTSSNALIGDVCIHCSVNSTVLTLDVTVTAPAGAANFTFDVEALLALRQVTVTDNSEPDPTPVPTPTPTPTPVATPVGTPVPLPSALEGTDQSERFWVGLRDQWRECGRSGRQLRDSTGARLMSCARETQYSTRDTGVMVGPQDTHQPSDPTLGDGEATHYVGHVAGADHVMAAIRAWPQAGNWGTGYTTSTRSRYEASSVGINGSFMDACDERTWPENGQLILIAVPDGDESNPLVIKGTRRFSVGNLRSATLEGQIGINTTTWNVPSGFTGHLFIRTFTDYIPPCDTGKFLDPASGAYEPTKTNPVAGELFYVGLDANGVFDDLNGIGDTEDWPMCEASGCTPAGATAYAPPGGIGFINPGSPPDCFGIGCDETGSPDIDGGETSYACAVPSAVMVGPWELPDPLGWLGYIACQVSLLPQTIGGIVAAALNTVRAWFVPVTLGSQWQAFLDFCATKVPFGWWSQIVGTIESSAGAASAGLSSFNLTVGTATVSIGDGIQDALDGVAPFRGLIFAGVALMMVMGCLRWVMAAVGVQPSSQMEGGSS